MSISRHAIVASVTVALFSVISASDVVTLTKDNFEETIAKEKLVFVKFFAPWCGHCKAMAEDFKSAAAELKGQAVLADVDATVEEDLAKKYNIQGFPTLKVFADGEELTDYNGGRDKESMIKFIQRATLPPYTEVADQAEYDKFVADNKGKNLVVAAELDANALAKFKKATFALRDIMPDAVEFAHASSPDAVKIDGIAKGDIYLLRAEKDGGLKEMKYDESADESIEAFVKKSALPTFQELTQSNAELYTEMTHPLVIGFYDDCTGEECKTLEKVAEANAGAENIAFAWVNKKTLESFMEYVGLKDAKTKIFAYSFTDDARFMLPEGFEFSESSLTSWINDLKAGKIEQTRKSQPVPETQDSPVHTIVGDSWADDVENANKDVFVAQVAEWCGHCKALKPVLKKVAEELSKAGVGHVRIAQMDATENDAPSQYKARGFPTVHFFPAGKGEGVEYDGDRSSKGIIDWIKEHTTTKFEFDTDSLGEDPKPEEGEEEMGEEGDEEGEADLAGEEMEEGDEAEEGTEGEDAGDDGVGHAKEDL